MKWLTELIGGKTVKEVGDAVDAIVTSDEERTALKNELAKITLGSLDNLVAAQASVLNTELSGSKLQRSWRPVLMLVFGFIVTFHYFIYPTLQAFKSDLPELPVLDSQFWVLLEIGVGGYVIGRSVEKTVGKFTENVDLSLLRRRDRRRARREEDEVIGD